MAEAKADCKELGLLQPVIDRNRCEGKEECVLVCPYAVFELKTLSASERASLSVFGRAKAFFHGYQQAFAVRADQCHACGACVSACSEHAITLQRPP
jgi:NAD-dependent dihydropyrimidine dehydrogenase PreA subunit